MAKPWILTGDMEKKVRAEIAEIRKQFAEAQNPEIYLDFMKSKRPVLILPAIKGSVNPLEKTRWKDKQSVSYYKLTEPDSDEDALVDHNYCKPRHFTGFKKTEAIDAVRRCFIEFDAQVSVINEFVDLEDLPKKPLHIKLELTESELIRAYAKETHYGFLLDRDFRVDEMCPDTDEELGTEEFNEKVKSFESSAPQNVCVIDGGGGAGMSTPRVSVDSVMKPSLGEMYGHCPGIIVNTIWTDRVNLAQSGCHRPLHSFIDVGPLGAYSLLLQNNSTVDDFGDSIVLHGEPSHKSTARKSKTQECSTVNNEGKNSQKKREQHDQNMTGGNLALYNSMVSAKPIRLVRSHAMNNAFSPSAGYRYEGLFYIYAIHTVKNSEQINEFRFILISDPSLFASGVAPRLWELKGKLPRLPLELNFGHPRDTVIGRGSRESVQETSHLQPVETVGAGLAKDTRRPASMTVTTDSERAKNVRRSTSVLSGLEVEAHFGKRSRLSDTESVMSSKSESMLKTRMLGATGNTVSKLVKKGQQRKLVKSHVECEKQKKLPVAHTESLKIYHKKSPRPMTETVLQSCELHTENKLMINRKEEMHAATPGPSTSYSHTNHPELYAGVYGGRKAF